MFLVRRRQAIHNVALWSSFEEGVTMGRQSKWEYLRAVYVRYRGADRRGKPE